MSRRLQGFVLFLVAMLISTSYLQFSSGVSHAQEPEAAAEEGAAAEGAEEGDAHPPQKSRFMWFVKSSGLIGLFLLILSIYFVAMVIRLFIELRTTVAHPAEEVAMCEQFMSNRDYQGLYDYTSKNSSFFSRLVSSGIAELPAGLPEAREVMDRVADVETVDMERKISMLAVLGSLGPMIGLVGTLKGMIASFAVIALSDTQLKSSEVAEGISEALLLTFEGVALSVPAIYFYAFFKNRVSKISVETLLAADEFIRRLVQQAKKPAATQPRAAHAMAQA